MSVVDDILGLRLDPRGPPERFGPYVIVDRVASGGMAEIYRARHEDDPFTDYALKCIRPDCDEEPEFRRMLLDEAQIASRLDHPNINRVHRVVRDGDRVALVLEHVDGLDLGQLQRHLRRTRTPLPVPLAIHIVREVLTGLDYAHHIRGDDGAYLHVVHRDVSPGNVMVDVQGNVILVDFGIARAQNRLAQTEVGNVKGKFRYMAPEQIKGGAVSPAVDTYATAIVLWELLAGQRIYDKVGVAQLMIRVANAHVPSLVDARPDVPEALERAYVRATARDPADRFLSAGAFATALDEIMVRYDPAECRATLARYVTERARADRQKGLDVAVARARAAAEHGLEDAILSALEDPDRVERVDLARVRRVSDVHPADEDLTVTGGHADADVTQIADAPEAPTSPGLPALRPMPED